MNDNVVKFRRIEKKPEKKPSGSGIPPKIPSWLAWLVLLIVAVALTAWQVLRPLG